MREGWVMKRAALSKTIRSELRKLRTEVLELCTEAIKLKDELKQAKALVNDYARWYGHAMFWVSPLGRQRARNMASALQSLPADKQNGKIPPQKHRSRKNKGGKRAAALRSARH